MWAAIQFLSRSLRIAAYSCRASWYSGLRRARPSAASAADLPTGLSPLPASLTGMSLPILISRRHRAASRRRVLARGPRRPPLRGVHPALEVRHPLLGQFDVGA